MSQGSPKVDHARDCGFLVAIVGLSAVLYVAQLGFYYDDWALLGEMSTSQDQSFLGLFRALYDVVNVQNRPVQALYLAALYRLFGETPRWYHVVNAGVLLSGILLLYLSLRALRVSRMLAVAIPAVYSSMPNFSTDRFWYAAFQVNLSMALYCVGLYCDARAAHGRRVPLWQAGGLASLLLSGLAYEVFLPLFLLNPALASYLARREHPGRGSHVTWRSYAIRCATIATLLAVKILTTSRLHAAGRGLGQHLSLTYWLFREALAMNYLHYGFGLPVVFVRAIGAYGHPTVITLGAVTGLTVYTYVARQGAAADGRPRGVASMLGLIALGVLVCGAGYAVFMFNYNLSFTPTGVGNRTAIAGALGAALSLVGVVGAASGLCRSPAARRHVFAAAVALVCAMGVTINNTLALFWVRAYQTEKDIMAGVREALGRPPAGATVLLDGFCPHDGPAVVFTIDWDVTGALMVCSTGSEAFAGTWSFPIRG